MTQPAGSVQRLDNWQVSPGGQVQGYFDQWTGQPLFRGIASQVGQVAVPSGIAPTGSVAANGALTLGTALQNIYGPTGVSPGIWLNFPAGAVFSGSPAGSYWCVMTSTTLGTIFNNILPFPGPWYPPTTPSTIVAAGPGAYTGVTTIQTAGGITLPANMMGPNGVVRVWTQLSVNNSAGNKTPTLNFGASSIVSYPVLTTVLAAGMLALIANRGVTNQQIGGITNASGLGSVATTTTETQIDTTAARNVFMQLQLATATDYVILEQFMLEVIPG